jgi:hypothetical protein
MAKKTKKRPAPKAKASAKARPRSGRGTSGDKVSALQSHFEQAGVSFNLPQSEILAAMKTLMGRKRHTEWWNASIARQQGYGPPEEEYRLLSTAEEINTLFSLQGPVSLALAEWITNQVSQSGLVQERIGDLGCCSGTLAGWLASQHPQCEVVGWDSLSNLIEAARAVQKAPNLVFETWDYASQACPTPHSCDLLVSSFGVDFPLLNHLHHTPLDISTLRAGPYYEKMLAFMQPIFRNWRTAIKNEGTLHAVLRIPSDSLFIATIDAAHNEGWSLDISSYRYISCGEEHFPGMMFRAASAPLLPEEVITSLWCRTALDKSFSSGIMDPAATPVFKSLGTRTILKTASRTYDDDHVMEAVVGTAGFLGFQYTHATTGFARLRLMSLDEAEKAEPWFPQPAFDDIW